MYDFFFTGWPTLDEKTVSIIFQIVVPSPVTMQDRKYHQQEIQAFLQKHFLSNHWEFELPNGSGNETYFALGNGHAYFVKLGVHLTRDEVNGIDWLDTARIGEWIS